MKLFIGSDHAGFELKEALKKYLTEKGYGVVDKGAYEYKEGDDYPDFIAPVAEEVSKDAAARGIVLGGSGQGEAITANRFPRVRAAVYYGGTQEIITLSREHNNANILSLGARFVSAEEAASAVELWLETPFSQDERHNRRLAKLEKIKDSL